MALPQKMYGTAWKEEQTADLTFQALQAGFKAIDTANQRKHYYEEAVGLGLHKFLNLSKLKREDIFLQTKFTFARGQDHRKPYNESDPFTKQVADSFASSLTHLKTDYIDSYVLHGPYRSDRISPEDLESWKAMEALVDSGKVKHLGISNVSRSQLADLCEQVKIRPRFVQNRCYARTGWDRDVRNVCVREGILYQGFSLLTANRSEIETIDILEIAGKYKKTSAQIIFRFCQQLRMIWLTGTSDVAHMKQDLEVDGFELNEREMKVIENIGRLD